MNGRNVVVLGLGVTGMSAARWAARHGASVRVVDTRAQPPRARQLAGELPHVSLTSGPIDDATLRGADLIVISPGWPSDSPRSRRLWRAASSSSATSSCSRVRCRRRQKVLAVTGSNGKTTVDAATAQLRAPPGSRPSRWAISASRCWMSSRAYDAGAVARCLRARAFEFPAGDDFAVCAPSPRRCSTCPRIISTAISNAGLRRGKVAHL